MKRLFKHLRPGSTRTSSAVEISPAPALAGSGSRRSTSSASSVSSLRQRGLAVALFGSAVVVLAGCPVYSGDSGDGRPYGGCPAYDDSCEGSYDAGVAPAPSADATTPPSSCTQPSQCPTGYTCAGGGVCELGDCSITGCLPGYVCELEGATLTCVLEGPPPDAGTPDSGSVACQSNADCAATAGAICLDGVCVPPANQCYDGTQCPTGDKCVQGACTPACLASADGGGSSCPTGYSCTDIDDASSAGVCTGNPTPCESNPSLCPTGTVCSQNHCVPTCGNGVTCPTGEECIQGGCVPNQNPIFTCSADGVQDACASGSICLHHSCYIACSPDAGTAACQSADQFNECKPVAAGSATFYVCGSSTNLGTECDPTDGQKCASSAAVCIDGFCH